jgi:acyl-CoA synthetase (AMP-forming)/AMP-acid ligase II
MLTVAQTIFRHYQDTPGKVCLTLLETRQPDKPITYDLLFRASLSYTRALVEQRVQPGEVIILILPHGEALVYAFFGAVLAGAVPAIMPFLTEKLSPEQYHRSLKALFAVTRPAAVITSSDFLSEVQRAMGTDSSVRLVLDAGQIANQAVADGAPLPGLQRQPSDLVLLQHSSGTTGLQKGVALSNRAVFNQVEAYAPAIQLSSQDVVVSWLPLYHDMGLIAGFLMPLLTGTHLVLMSPFDWVRAPYRLLQAVSRYKGTLSWLPNFAYNFCAQKIRPRDLENVDLSSWRAVINCSEPMYWSSHAQFLQRFQPYGLRPQALATCYAMAENVFAVTQGGIDQPVRVDEIDRRALQEQRRATPAQGNGAIKMLSAGRPIHNTSVRILDDHGAPLPERRVGEIALQSNCLLSSYYNRPELTSQSFRDGWYLTGDLGYLADGEVFITGRKKDLIIVGGKNIYPQDLEYLAGEVPGVHPGRVAVFGLPNETTGTEEVVLVAETDLPDPQSWPTLADELRSVITRSSDIALRRVHIVPHGWLLKTSSGKVARRANRDKYLSEQTPHA